MKRSYYYHKGRILVLSPLIEKRVFSIKTGTIQNHKTLIFNENIFDWFTIVGIK